MSGRVSERVRLQNWIYWNKRNVWITQDQKANGRCRRRHKNVFFFLLFRAYGIDVCQKWHFTLCRQCWVVMRPIDVMRVGIRVPRTLHPSTVEVWRRHDADCFDNFAFIYSDFGYMQPTAVACQLKFIEAIFCCRCCSVGVLLRVLLLRSHYYQSHHLARAHTTEPTARPPLVHTSRARERERQEDCESDCSREKRVAVGWFHFRFWLCLLGFVSNFFCVFFFLARLDTKLMAAIVRHCCIFICLVFHFGSHASRVLEHKLHICLGLALVRVRVHSEPERTRRKPWEWFKDGKTTSTPSPSPFRWRRRALPVGVKFEYSIRILRHVT